MFHLFSIDIGHLTRSFVVVLLAALHDLAVTLAYDTKS